jgi:hypothetical protein
MIKNNSKIIDGWTIHFEEVSNNVYKVELIDNFGRQASTTDHDLEKAIETCLSYSFDIERQLNNSLNKFTYDTFKYFLNYEKILTDNYSDKDFGSWIIQKSNKRIIFDGKDSILILQSQTEEDNWTDDLAIKLTDLTFKQITELKEKFKNDN